MVIRINNRGEMKNSRPCNNCIRYMKLFNVRKVYYSDNDGDIVLEKVKDMEYLHSSVAQRNI
jgi:hypothetical protein